MNHKLWYQNLLPINIQLIQKDLPLRVAWALLVILLSPYQNARPYYTYRRIRIINHTFCTHRIIADLTVVYTFVGYFLDYGRERFQQGNKNQDSLIA